MIWFRRHITLGSRLALFALAVQLTLVFGHVHTIHAQFFAQAAFTSAPSIPTANGVDDGHATATLSVSDSRSSRSDHHPPDETCGICALIAMSANALFSQPPVLSLPHAFAFIDRFTDVGFAPPDTPGTAFNPRAPPVS